MAAIIGNRAKGRFVHYAVLGDANDALIAVVLKTAGLESQATLQDYDDLAAILAAANDEADFAGYARATLTGVTVTIDDTNNWVLVDCNDPVFSPTAAQAVGEIVFVYDPDTTGGTDSTVIPIFFDDAFALTTPTSGTITYVVASGGFGKAA